MTASVHLIEMQAVGDGALALTETLGIGARAVGALGLETDFTGPETTFRLSDREYTSRWTDSIGVRRYRGFVTVALTIDRRMPLDPGAEAYVGASVAEVEVASPGGYWNAIVPDHAVDGRSIRILRGTCAVDDARGVLIDPAYSACEPMIIGSVLRWRLLPEGLRIEVRDRTARIERVYQTDYYGGTGGADGGEDIAGQPVPICRGSCKNVTPILEDPDHLIYRVNNRRAEITAVYERGVAGYVDAGDVADRAALVAASEAGGSFVTCEAEGRFRLFPAGDIQGEITCDALGWFRDLYRDTPARIARHMLAEDLGLGSSVLDEAAFSTLHEATPHEAGIYFADERDAVDVLGEVLRSVGACLVPTRGSYLAPLRLAPPSGDPAASYDTRHILAIREVALPETLSPPTYRRTVGYDRNWTVQTPDLDAAVTPARRSWLAQSFRTTVWFDGDVRLRHIRAGSPAPIVSILRGKTAAQAIADALGALWGVERRAYEIDVPLEAPVWDLGSVIEVDYPLGPFDGRALCRVIGERMQSRDGRITMTVLL